MDLKDLLQQLRLDFKESLEHKNVRHGWIGLDCPWCGTYGKYHLGVNLQTLQTTCWQCGGHGLPQALSMCSNWDLRETYQLVQKLDRWTNRSQAKGSAKGYFKPPKFGDLESAHRRYLSSRGFNPDRLASTWGLGGITRHYRLGWRIYIPIHHMGKPVSWTSRAIGENSSKYISAKPEEEMVSHKSILYGEDQAANAIIVVEGPADVWKIGPGAVATLGVKVTPSQTSRISKYPVRAICFDNEIRAQHRAKSLADSLSMLPGETMLIQLDSDDPGSASDREIRLLRQAVFGE